MKRIERVLATCVDDIEAGKTTIEECLERYRELSAELEPLLRLALEIEKLPSVSPSKVFKARARANVVVYAYDHPARRSRWQSWWSSRAAGQAPPTQRSRACREICFIR